MLNFSGVWPLVGPPEAQAEWLRVNGNLATFKWQLTCKTTKYTKHSSVYTKVVEHFTRCSRAQPVSECDQPEARGLRAFANLLSRWPTLAHVLAGSGAGEVFESLGEMALVVESGFKGDLGEWHALPQELL